MTDQQSRPVEDRAGIPRPRIADGAVPPGGSGPGMGWVRFGGVVMTVLGAFAVFEGLVALFSPTYFLAAGGSVLVLDFTGWGWIHLILGVLVLATGLSLLGSAPPWARGVGIVLVAINAIVQLAFLPAYPIWSIILIVLDMVVLYALVVTPVDDAQRA